MTEPAPRRHRRRERHRRRGAGTDGSPAAAGGTPGEYAASEAPAPVEEAPPAKDRRRFRRRARDDSGKAAAAQPAPAPPAERPPVAESAEAVRAKVRPVRRPDLERGLRGIVGAGPSQVGVAGAMRARDAARPTAEDLAAAERDLVIVRRHYVPPDTDPRPS